MPEPVRCGACSLCAEVQGCGFCAPRTLWCTQHGRAVEPWDGCTFGEDGQPMAGALGYGIDISGHAAVGGDCGEG